MTTVQPDRDVSLQGHYAGAVSRLAAYVADLFLLGSIFTLLTAGLNYALELVTRRDVDFGRYPWVVIGALLLWSFVWFCYPWAVSGKTAGMGLLGIKVVAADGDDATPKQALVRTIAFPLSFLLLGLGFLGILVQRERRALHDLIAGTAVVYAWDARTARYRFLARQTETTPADEPASRPARPGPAPG